MEMKVQRDLRVVLSFTEEEILKLLTYLEHSELVCDVSRNRSYDNLELDNYVYDLSKEVNLLLEDKLGD